MSTGITDKIEFDIKVNLTFIGNKIGSEVYPIAATKAVQIGVTVPEDEVMATATPAKCSGYRFLGYYTDRTADEEGIPASEQVYDAEGNVKADCSLFKDGKWYGIDENGDVTDKLYAMWWSLNNFKVVSQTGHTVTFTDQPNTTYTAYDGEENEYTAMTDENGRGTFKGLTKNTEYTVKSGSTDNIKKVKTALVDANDIAKKFTNGNTTYDDTNDVAENDNVKVAFDETTGNYKMQPNQHRQSPAWTL